MNSDFNFGSKFWDFMDQFSELNTQIQKGIYGLSLVYYECSRENFKNDLTLSLLFDFVVLFEEKISKKMDCLEDSLKQIFDFYSNNKDLFSF